MEFNRKIKHKFNKWLSRHEVILIYGARQIGKTTFIKSFVKNTENAIYYNCENSFVKSALSEFNADKISSFFGNNKYICLDEGQTIDNIGKILKFIHDELPQFKLIVTSSSSFELTDKLLEPLTGRNISLKMHPLSLNEVYSNTENLLEIQEKFESILVYGLYPEIYTSDHSLKKEKLYQISSDYMFKDVLIFDEIRQSHLLRKIIQYLAYTVGSEISSSNIANEFQVARQTVDKYLDVLEKMFIIFSLSSYSRNQSNELKKKKKYFFFDNGLRNALINNFNPIESRSDVGALWENFCISEIMKRNLFENDLKEYYFWRTYDGAEVDLVQEKDGLLNIWEFKWNQKKKTRFPKSFIESYKVGKKQIVSRDDLYYFIK